MQAGGNLGPTVLAGLDADPHFTVSILSRQESTSTFPDKYKVHKTDYTLDSLVAAFKGQDAVVSTITTTSTSLQKDVIDAAVKAGVKRFIPAEFGGDTSNPATHEVLPAFAAKVEVIDYLRSKESSGLTWTGILTGPFFDWYVYPPHGGCIAFPRPTAAILCAFPWRLIKQPSIARWD